MDVAAKAPSGMFWGDVLFSQWEIYHLEFMAGESIGNMLMFFEPLKQIQILVKSTSNNP